MKLVIVALNMQNYQKNGNNDKEILVSIEKAVNSSINLRSISYS